MARFEHTMALVPLVAIGGAAAIATMAGGIIALKFASKRPVLAGFGAGAVVTIAFFDLIPEAFHTAGGLFRPFGLGACIVAGFLLYLVLDRIGQTRTARSGPSRWGFGAAPLVLHSTLDGLGIGVAFLASPQLGMAVTVAVLTHDLVDGANTVALSVGGVGYRFRPWIWLVLDALAPIVGILLAHTYPPPPDVIAPVLAFFGGVFLYLGLGELLPRSFEARWKAINALPVICGVAAVTSALLLSAS